jgi:hypothetical protein
MVKHAPVKDFKMDTLLAIAVVVGALKGHDAPRVVPPPTVLTERRNGSADKPMPRRYREPSIGF